MKRFEAARSYRTRALALVVLLGGIAWLACPAYAAAQSTQRSVQGRVVSSADVPIRSAIVYLSDARTLGVESYITQEDGSYRFEQISPSDDYKLWAQADGKKSKTKTLSSFDDRKTFHVILKIDTGK